MDVTFTLPHPIRVETMRGAMSLGLAGRCIAVRLHDDDIAHLDELVEKIGIPRAALARWFIVYAIKALYKHHFNKDIEIRQ